MGDLVTTYIERTEPAAPSLPGQAGDIPASNWARPPAKMAMPTTTLGVATPRACTLIRERIKVVDANENSPLYEFS